jgi:hypothetical protein
MRVLCLDFYGWHPFFLFPSHINLSDEIPRREENPTIISGFVYTVTFQLSTFSTEIFLQLPLWHLFLYWNSYLNAKVSSEISMEREFLPTFSTFLETFPSEALSYQCPEM